MKRTMTLSEHKLRKIISEEVNRLIKESVSFKDAQAAALKANKLGRYEQAININRMALKQFERDFNSKYAFYDESTNTGFRAYNATLVFTKNGQEVWTSNGRVSEEKGYQIANSLRAGFRRKMLAGLHEYYDNFTYDYYVDWTF